MKKKYIVVRYWSGSHAETMGKPMTKKEAESLCEALSKKASMFTEYKVHKIGTTRKKIKLI
jgi:hypothetical protein